MNRFLDRAQTRLGVICQDRARQARTWSVQGKIWAKGSTKFITIKISDSVPTLKNIYFMR